MNKRLSVELFLLFIFTTAVFVLYFFIQPVLTYSTCGLCDGNQYLQIYSYFARDSSGYEVAFPYYSRVVVPFLASLLPGNVVIMKFQFLNLTFSVLSVIAIYYLWKKLEISFYLILTGLFWLLFHWTGMIRLNQFDPLTVDVPTYLIQALFVLIFIKKKFKWLWLLAPVAVLQRESIIVLLIVLFIFSYIYNHKSKEEVFPLKDIFIALLLSIVVKFLFTLNFPPSDPGKSSVRLVLFYIKEVLYDPFKIVRWIVGVFIAFGAFFILALQNVKLKDFSSPFFLFISIMSFVYIMFGIIAGGDSTRIVFLGFPFIMTWILLIVKDVSWKLLSAALLLSVFLMRLPEAIPDIGKDFAMFASWYPEFANPHVVLLWGIYMVFCYFILFGFNKYLSKR